MHPKEEGYIGAPGGSFWRYGQKVSLHLSGTQVGVFEIIPEEKVGNPLLLNAEGKVKLEEGTIVASEVRGPVGHKRRLSFIDSKGRVIQTQSINYMQGTDVATSQYTWDGRVIANLISHNINSTKTINPQSHLVASAMTYDAMGRLITITKTISSTVNGVAVAAKSSLIVTNQYNELSQLHITTLGNNLESLTYDYNVRGWLLGANRNYISGASNTNKFGFELAYDNTASVAPGNAYNAADYNGVVAGTTWKSAGDGINRRFSYTYDNLNRLLSAPFKQNTTGTIWDNSPIDFSISNLSYDANGNIGSMTQNGYIIGGSQAIDNLTYSYVNGKNAGTGANYSNRLVNVMDASNNPSSSLGDLHYPSSKTGSNVDYNYDANGNITSDYNRAISAISYWNELNLPNTITVTNKGTIQYTYDAAGNKLQKIATENNVTVPYNNTNYTTNIITTTKYVDGFVYKTVSYSNAALSSLNLNNTDVFQFTGNEVGRIRFKPAIGTVLATYAFDYFIKDNLGNVRMVLTDETPTDIYPAATLEKASYNGGIAATVEGQYYNINSADIITTATSLPWFAALAGSSYANTNGNPANPDPYSDQNSGIYSANVYWLNGVTGDKTGLGITLKVVAGDQFSIFGKSVWHNPTSAAVIYQPITSALSNFLAGFASSLNGSSLITHGITGASLAGVSTTTIPLGNFLNNTPNNGNQPNGLIAPKAAINWILFDDQFRPLSVGTNLVKTTPDVIYSHNFPLNMTIAKSGYLYVYCSNESNMDVYFDNLQVTLTHGPILEENHYYPVGLAMAAICDRAFGKQQNYYHYQGNEMQNQEWYDGTGLEEYDFHARYYDQQLGVWHNQDPAGQFSSPYLAMGDSWVNGTDPDGSWFIIDDFAVGFIKGLAEGIFGDNQEGHHTIFGDALSLGSTMAADDATIWGGLFATDPHKNFWGRAGELISRFTWQLSQEAIGFAFAQEQNLYGTVNHVDYFDGLTVLHSNIEKVGDAFTLGNYSTVDRTVQESPSDATFVHEYGRYLSSEAEGPDYLYLTAIPNVMHNIKWLNGGRAWGNDDASSIRANARSFIYFSKYYGGYGTRSNRGPNFWDFYDGLAGGDPLPGYTWDLPFTDPENQAALHRDENWY